MTEKKERYGGMESPMDRLDLYMEEQAEAQRTTEQPALSAEGLRMAMYWAVERQYSAALAAAEAQDVARTQREMLEMIEALAIDAWIGTTPEADRKRVVGANEDERRRNTVIMLAKEHTVIQQRVETDKAERAAAIAQIKFEQAQERVKNLRSIAWCYGGECNRGYEPVEDKAAKRDRALPAELMAGRAGLKLVRDTAE